MVNYAQRFAGATVITLLLIISIVGAAFWINNTFPATVNPEKIQANLTVTGIEIESTIYRGENLNVQIQINVSAQTHFDYALFSFQRSSRISHYWALINQTFQKGNFSVDAKITPGIYNSSADQFFALSDGSYTLVSMNYTFSVNHVKVTKTFQISRTVSVIPYPIFNRLKTSTWQITGTGFNSTVIASDGTITFPSGIGTATATTVSNFTAATHLTLTLPKGLSGLLTVGNISKSISGGNETVNVAAIDEMQTITMTVDTETNSSEINITVVLETKKRVLLVVVANDRWDTNFPSSHTIIEEVNQYFQYWFNLTFKVILDIPIVYNGSTALPELFEFAKKELGNELKLSNNQWSHARGRRIGNLGADIMMINTNKTMSNYGMVIGDSMGGYNMLANAGGSLNANGFRLAPEWADNLFQHELSHVFGAPDRRTGIDLPSVMTKSETLQELTQDLNAGTLWLTLNTWLPEDIKTMATQLKFYDNFQG